MAILNLDQVWGAVKTLTPRQQRERNYEKEVVTPLAFRHNP
jgi:hypothetical protein